MGIRIHTSLGWGMPIKKFEKYSLVPDEDEETIHGILTECKELLIPKGLHEKRVIFSGHNLLSKEFNYPGTPSPKDAKNASNLIRFAGSDDAEHVIFYPSMYFLETWFRFDDAIDYAFATNITKEMKNTWKYLKHGHYPFNIDRMNLKGEHQDRDNYEILRFTDKKKAAKIVPEVPFELRWWVKELKILDDEGVNQLRPIMASWWS